MIGCDVIDGLTDFSAAFCLFEDLGADVGEAEAAGGTLDEADA